MPRKRHQESLSGRLLRPRRRSIPASADDELFDESPSAGSKGLERPKRKARGGDPPSNGLRQRAMQAAQHLAMTRGMKSSKTVKDFTPTRVSARLESRRSSAPAPPRVLPLPPADENNSGSCGAGENFPFHRSPSPRRRRKQHPGAAVRATNLKEPEGAAPPTEEDSLPVLCTAPEQYGSSVRASLLSLSRKVNGEFNQDADSLILKFIGLTPARPFEHLHQHHHAVLAPPPLPCGCPHPRQEWPLPGSNSNAHNYPSNLYEWGSALPSNAGVEKGVEVEEDSPLSDPLLPVFHTIWAQDCNHSPLQLLSSPTHLQSYTPSYTYTTSCPSAHVLDSLTVKPRQTCFSLTGVNAEELIMPQGEASLVEEEPAEWKSPESSGSLGSLLRSLTE